MLNYYFNSGHSEESLKGELRMQVAGYAMALNEDIGLYTATYGDIPKCTVELSKPENKKKNYQVSVAVHSPVSEEGKNNIANLVRKMLTDILVPEGTAHTLETVH